MKIRAKKDTDKHLALTLETDCEMVLKMLGDIAKLDRFAPITGFQNNPVYKSAAKHLKHVACPVPAGIIKALEVAAGLNVEKDAAITFLKEEE